VPSDIHETLFLRLNDITTQMMTALSGEIDDGAVASMMAVHQEIMNQLAGAGDCHDPSLLPLLQKIKSGVDTVVQELELKKEHYIEKIQVSKNKRKLATAYGPR